MVSYACTDQSIFEACCKHFGPEAFKLVVEVALISRAGVDSVTEEKFKPLIRTLMWFNDSRKKINSLIEPLKYPPYFKITLLGLLYMTPVANSKQSIILMKPCLHRLFIILASQGRRQAH